MRRAALALSALAVLGACGPISPERAADLCEERARAAAGPTGEIGIGYSSRDGAQAKAEVGITSDFLFGRDPQVVYEQCVREKTGQGPIRPLNLGR